MIGSRILHFKITAKLGKGGMGEVWRAEDSKLGREVAIKLLPEEVSRDPERLSRFEREAKLLASLNHTNIAAIYEVGEATVEDLKGPTSASTGEADGAEPSAVHFLVMELAEGETLADRSKLGPVAIDEALPIAIQIAEALEVAHEQGIIHRDLKPANVKVSSDGQVKVLDFGLAKALDIQSLKASGTQDLSLSPTLTANLTGAGVLLGTAAYMSPEQARGKAVDKRSDIWAFGCVVYEMLTAKRAFPGETVTDLIAAVVKSDPDLDALPPHTPWRVRELLRRCFVKDPRQRIHDIADARIELVEAQTEPAGAQPEGVVPVARDARHIALPWLLSALLAVAAIGLGWQLLGTKTGHTPEVQRFSITLPRGIWLSGGEDLALAPDGTRLVLAGSDGESQRLYVRSMDELEFQPIPGTEGADRPFFSADGQWVGFTDDLQEKLKKVSLETGAVVVLCDATWGGGAWGSDGSIIFTPSYSTGLHRVAAAGGSPETLTSRDLGTGELGHFWPQVLADGRAVLFTNFSVPLERARIELYFFSSGERRTLIEGGVFGRYVPTGHLVFVRDDVLMAVPFDIDRLEVTGTPVPILEDIPGNRAEGYAPVVFSGAGSMVYIPGSSLAPGKELLWVDRQGTREPVTETRRRYGSVRLSPDGRRVALSSQEESIDLWIYEIERRTLGRVTFEATTEFCPLWLPNGRKLVFILDQPPYDIFWMPADGSGLPEPLVTNDYDKIPNAVSPDGTLLFYHENHPETGGDLWLVPLAGEHEPRLFLRTPFNERSAAFSPDGKWVAYQSDMSGRFEIYVQPFPGPGTKTQVSIDGGREPLWSDDGKELFFRDGLRMMAVATNTGSEFRSGAPTILFEGRYFFWSDLPSYDIAADGRFIMLRTPDELLPRELHVVLDWFAELERLVPTE